MDLSKRVIETLTNGNAEVTTVRQRNGKLDNAYIDFGSNDFDGQVLYDTSQIDQFNCYPYVVRVREDQEADVLISANEIGIPDRVLVNPSELELMYAMSMAKGASKGYNGSKSGNLDGAFLEWVQDILYAEFDNKINVFKPCRSGKSDSEDIRVVATDNNVELFKQENKCISEKLNITERFHMVKGKGDYDLFVSFVGYKEKFLDLIQELAPKHIAKAYIEFGTEVQPAILAEKGKDKGKIFNNAIVLLPADENDPSKGFIKGGLLRDYYINTVRAALEGIK